AAGEVILEVYATDLDVAYKGKNDPVTDADQRANELIVSRLAASFPGDGIVAEESPDRSDALRSGRVWYVDPLDGTKEFVKKNGEFAVMIGLTIDGEAHAGVVYQPVKDKLWAGIVGDGAYLEEGGERRPLAVSEVADPKDLKLVVSRSHRAASTDQLVERLGITNEVSHGSVGLKIGMLAERVADLYVIMAPKSSKWDACGPEAVLRAAGGRFADLSGAPFAYQGEEMLNLRGILACNAASWDAVLPVARTIAEETGLL
ncbi:MAG: 3'(2'),5'-bisphosphate nucleotidase CysQ, partial [Deltaproteobacteria bacterium]|nr:3'(2'),5'-bisphosphate nucleotidase CysQ [Deltaproteobacteria bacterium]